MSRTIAQTAAIRASRPEESALLRSASSWSMASATRRRADSSIEHTVEDYQVDGACGRAFVSPVIHRSSRLACGQRLWITDREIPVKVFLPHSRWIRFPLLTRAYLSCARPFPQFCPQAAHNVAGVSAHLVHTFVHPATWCRAWRAAKMSEPSTTTVSGEGRSAFVPRSLMSRVTHTGGGAGERHRDFSAE
jgi:hypothetical protein